MRRIFALCFVIMLVGSIFFATSGECRYYDPKTGRFLQRDPVETDDENTYTYNYNDPVNLVDPYGEQGLPQNFYPPYPLGFPSPGQNFYPPSLGEDVGLPAPPVPGQYAPPNAKRKETYSQQEGISESVTKAATKGEQKGEKDKKKKPDPDKEKEQKQNKPPGNKRWDENRKRWVDNDYVYTWDKNPHDKRGGGSHWDRGRMDGQGRGDWSPDGINWFPK